MTELIQCPGSYSGAYTIPNGVTSIGNRAFDSCTALTSVEIGDSLTNIGLHAFYDCKSLTSMTIPDSITKIGQYAFYNCKSLTSMTIPDGVTAIEYSAFASCEALTSATLPDSVTNIGYTAFIGCTALRSITIPKTVKMIDEGAFYACDALADVYYDGTMEDWSGITIREYNTALTNARIHFKGDTITDENLNPTMNITAGAEMAVNYSIVAEDVSAYEDFYLVVERETADGQTVSTTYGVVDEKSTRDANARRPLTVISDPATGEALMYSATYEGINAKEMGDKFTSTLYCVATDGTKYCSPVEDSSMKEYLLSRFHDAAATAELKTMVVDMLKYGAAAQINFGYDVENLVTNELTEEQLALATQTIPEATDDASESGTGANVKTNITVNSKVELALSCIAAGQANPAGVKCVITDADGKTLAELATTNLGGVMYSTTYDNVGAREMRKVITATFYNAEGTVISKTVNWSVESYVAQVRANSTSTATEIAMVDAMLTYGDSVAAYIEAK